jgi:Ca-activated chloride channel family protein
MRIFFSLLVVMFLSLHSFAQNVNEIMSVGNQYYKQAQFDLAETQYRKALQLDSKNTTAQYNLANALQKQKKYDEAIKVLDALSSSLKDNELKSAVYYNEGVANTKNQDLDASIEMYKKALRINPNDGEARENLEKALIEKKQKQQQQSQQKQKPQSNMSQKEAEQKLKLLEQKERQLQQRMQNKNGQSGNKQAQDW